VLLSLFIDCLIRFDSFGFFFGVWECFFLIFF